MNRILLIIVSIILVFMGVMAMHYIVMGYLPPRTPHKVARAVTKLPVPNTAQVIEFDESWSLFQGDGALLLELGLDIDDFNRLHAVAIHRGYQLIDSTQLKRNGLSGYGLAHIEYETGYKKIIYLDEASSRIFIRVINL